MIGAPAGAAEAMLKLALSDRPCGSDVMFENVSPDHEVERLAPARFVPFSVTATFEPWIPLEGFVPVTDGGALFMTAKLSVVAPPAALSVTGAFPTEALGARLN